MDFLDFIRKVAQERREKGFVIKGGKGSGWFAPPKGTHTKGAKAGAKRKGAKAKAKGIRPQKKYAQRVIVGIKNRGLAKFRGTVRGYGEPSVPDVGSSKKPIQVGPILAYRKKGFWFFRNPKSAWLPDEWSRGDWDFQIDMDATIGEGPFAKKKGTKAEKKGK